MYCTYVVGCTADLFGTMFLFRPVISRLPYDSNTQRETLVMMLHTLTLCVSHVMRKPLYARVVPYCTLCMELLSPSFLFVCYLICLCFILTDMLCLNTYVAFSLMCQEFERESHIQAGSPISDGFCLHLRRLHKTILGRVDLCRRVDNKQLIVVKTSNLHRKEHINTNEDPLAECQLLRRLSGLKVPELLGEWIERIPQSSWSGSNHGPPREHLVHRYAMSYGGKDLFGFVSHHELLEPSMARSLFGQILDSVSALHSALVVHLDLKMENLLIDDDHTIRICDLGQARVLPHAFAPQAGVVGTPAYRAPEIITGMFDGAQADMYSLGVILFIMLCGCPPFELPSRTDRAFWAIWNGGRSGLERVVNAYKGVNFLSSEALDLISSLLCPAENRLSMDQVMAHPWMNPVSPDRAPDRV